MVARSGFLLGTGDLASDDHVPVWRSLVLEKEFLVRGICLTQVTTMGSVQAWWRNIREI
jgi:hypothetical protein